MQIFELEFMIELKKEIILHKPFLGIIIFSRKTFIHSTVNEMIQFHSTNIFTWLYHWTWGWHYKTERILRTPN